MCGKIIFNFFKKMKARKNKLSVIFATVSVLALSSFAIVGSAGAAFSIGTGYGLPSGSIYLIVLGILNWLLAIFAIIGIIGFLISGIMYIISAGDEGLADKAKNGMKYSIIGVLVGLSGFIFIQAINRMLSGLATF